MLTWLVRLLLAITLLVPLAACEEDTTDDKKFSEYFSDDFDRADGDVGDPWVTDIPVGSSLQIVSQRVEVNTGGGSPSMFHPDSLDDDVRVTVDVIIAGGDYDPSEAFGIFARASDPNRDVTFGQGYFCSVWDGAVAIIIPTQTDPVVLGSGTELLSLTNGAEYTLVFTINGGNLLCQAASGNTLADEVEIDDDTISAGYVGLLGGENGTDFHWDNFVLETK